MNRPILFALNAGFVISAIAAFGACSDDTATGTQQPAFTPGVGNGVGGPSGGGSSPDGGGSTGTSGGPATTDGGCPNTPAGCFCGTPTTQQQFLNRCTTAAALPVSLTVKPATTADIP